MGEERKKEIVLFRRPITPSLAVKDIYKPAYFILMPEKKKSKRRFAGKLGKFLKDESAFFDKNKLVTAASLVAAVSMSMLPSRATISNTGYSSGKVVADHSANGSHSSHGTHGSHATHMSC